MARKEQCSGIDIELNSHISTQDDIKTLGPDARCTTGGTKGNLLLELHENHMSYCMMHYIILMPWRSQLASSLAVNRK